jgi:hypothetical protein
MRKLVVIASSCLSVLTLVSAAHAADSPPTRYRETEGDQPAKTPARANKLARSPGAVVAVGPYVSHQANVDENGQNIVGDAANEPSIAVNPIDPNNIVIVWRQFDNVLSNFRQAGHAYSFDRGVNWTFPGPLTPGTFRSDPVVDADSAGGFYYNSLQNDFDMDVFKSLDGGVNWGPPVPAFGGDKNWMAVDRSGGIGDGNVYGMWQLSGGCCGSRIFTRSTDGAESFEEPVDVKNTPVLGTMAIGPDGEVLIAGIEGFGNEFAVARSNNAQDADKVPTFVGREIDLGGGLGTPPGDNPNPGGLTGQTWVAVDRSNRPSRGNVYVLMSVNPPGDDPQDVNVIRSSDGGRTWSAPVRVNDDPLSTNAWQWFGTLGVAPNGRLDAVWNDTRESGEPNLSRLYYAYSWDAGRTWSKNVPVSPVFDSHVGWPNQNKIGDYYGMVSDELGGGVAYSATFNGEQDVYYLNVFPDCNDNGVSDVQDLTDGTSRDLNGDRIPDECQLVLGEPEPGEAGQQNTIAAEAGTPGATVRFALGRGPGSRDVPGCPGLKFSLGDPLLLGSAVVGDNGVAQLTFDVPGGAAGQTVGFQAVEAGSCKLSDRVRFKFPAQTRSARAQ